MLNVRKFLKSIGIVPKSSTEISSQGEMEVLTSDGALHYHNGTSASAVTTADHTQTLTNKTLSGNTATNLVNGSGTLNINSSGAVTIPNATDTLVGKATVDTLSNKTIDTASSNTIKINGNTLSATSGTATVTIPNSTDTLVNLSGSQVLTNKTLSGNTATNLVSGSGTLTLNTSGTATVPNVTDTLVSRTSTDTGANRLQNKDLSANNVNVVDNTDTTKKVAFTASGSSTSTTTTIAASSTTSRTLTLPDATDTLTANAATQSLSNKTFSDSITAAQIATPATPSSGFDRLYFKSDDKLYTLNSAGVETAIGSGSGGINYIANPDAESSTTGWATYSNTAANVPSTGTGGTATGLTFARSTSSPLRGAASFLITQANSTSLQGKGVSYDFTIDSEDQARVLNISFNYNASSTFVTSDGSTPPLNDGTTTTNAGNSDIEVFLYDKTNAVLIPVTPQVITGKGSNNFAFAGSFQTASNSTSYRLIFHCATTSANATGYTFKFDNVSVGPNAIGSADRTVAALALGNISGTVSSSLASATTVAFATLSHDTHGAYNTSNGIYTVPVSGIYEICGTVKVLGTFTAGQFAGAYLYQNTNNVLAEVTMAQASGSQLYISFGFQWKFNAGDQLTFRVASSATSPSLGSDGLQNFIAIKRLSGASAVEATDGRVVAAAGVKTAAGSSQTGITTATEITLNTTRFDTHAAMSTNGRFTAPVSGYYKLTGSIFYATTTAPTEVDFYFLKNGTGTLYGTYSEVSGIVANQNKTAKINAIVQLNAGDYVSMWAAAVTNAITVNKDNNDETFMYVERLSGPSTIAASESVAALYKPTTSPTGSLSNTTHTVVYNNKITDTHNAYNTSTGVYTVPVSGTYSITASFNLTGTFSAGNLENIYVFVDGSSYQAGITSMQGSATSIQPKIAIGGVKLVAGQQVSIQSYTDGSGQAFANSSEAHHFSITRTGN